MCLKPRWSNFIVDELQAKVSDLKEKLASVSSVAVSDQRLIFRGRYLNDPESRLLDIGILDGHTLHLAIRNNANSNGEYSYTFLHSHTYVYICVRKYV